MDSWGRPGRWCWFRLRRRPDVSHYGARAIGYCTTAYLPACFVSQSRFKEFLEHDAFALGVLVVSHFCPPIIRRSSYTFFLHACLNLPQGWGEGEGEFKHAKILFLRRYRRCVALSESLPLGQRRSNGVPIICIAIYLRSLLHVWICPCVG